MQLCAAPLCEWRVHGEALRAEGVLVWRAQLKQPTLSTGIGMYNAKNNKLVNLVLPTAAGFGIYDGTPTGTNYITCAPALRPSCITRVQRNPCSVPAVVTTVYPGERGNGQGAKITRRLSLSRSLLRLHITRNILFSTKLQSLQPMPNQQSYLPVTSAFLRGMRCCGAIQECTAGAAKRARQRRQLPADVVHLRRLP